MINWGALFTVECRNLQFSEVGVDCVVVEIANYWHENDRPLVYPESGGSLS